MNFSGFGVWPFAGVWPIAGATPPNVKPPANAAPLLRNPLRSDFMGLSFADEPGKKSLRIIGSIGERPQPQSLLCWRVDLDGRRRCRAAWPVGASASTFRQDYEGALKNL